MQNLKKILLSFQAFSGLAVNYTKLGLVVLGKEEAWVKQVAERLGCTLVKLPFTYLGVPLGANMKNVKVWQAVIDKMQNRLNSWKGSCLSRAEKLVLIKAVLNSLPMYFLSIFKLLKKLAKEIIKIQRRFLWKEGKFSALIKWEIIQLPKDKGGLGVTDLMLQNTTLLFKWWWRYACEEDCLWRKIVNSIHNEDLALLPNNSVSSMLGPWREIKKMAREESPVMLTFHQNIILQIGNGAKI